tara:strand:+ start:947 stop:2383 length:1437 start_codon:yes stop_codon:yes gene_type:complete
MSYIKQADSGGGDTYTLRATQAGGNPDVELELDAAAGADSKVTLKAGTNITLTEASDTVTIDATGAIGGTIANEQVAVGSGTNTISGSSDLTWNGEKLTIKNTNGQDALRIESSEPSGNPAPDFRMIRTITGVANNDLGHIFFAGQDAAGADEDYVDMYGEIDGVIAGQEAGRFYIRVKDKGAMNEILRIRGEDNAGQSRVDWNRGTEDIDFIVNGESANLIYADASQNRVGINTSSPSSPLTVAGIIETTSGGVKFPDGTTQTSAASGGGGGVTPPGMPTGNSDVYDEVMGLSNGLMGPYSGGSATTVQWANDVMRYRPHFFSRTGTINTVIFNMVSVPTSTDLQTISFALYESDSNNQPGDLKATSQGTYNSASSTGITLQSWTAEAGKDLNVTAGEMYFCAFHSTYGSVAAAASLSFWNSVAFLGGLGVDFDTTPQAIMVWYPSSTGFAPATLNVGNVAGDSSGFTWPMWMVDYS